MATKNAELTFQVQMIAESFNVIHAILRRGQQQDIAAIGLTGPQVSLLQTLAISDGLTLKQLSERMGLAHSTVSGIVDRLEQKAMLSRQPDEEDKRYTRVFLGNQILDYLSHARPSHRADVMMRALELADEAERQLIVDGLTKLRQLLEQVSIE